MIRAAKGMNGAKRELPRGWRWVRLGEVCEFHHGGTPLKANLEFWLGNIPWISPKDMKTILLEDAEDHITQDAIDNSATGLVPAGSILIVVRSGILARRLPVAIAGRDLAFNQDIKAAVLDKGSVDSQFLLFCLLSMEPNILADGIKRGATVHSVKSGYIENLRIPLPPLAEQKRIAAILNEQMATVERVRAASQVQLAAAAALPAARIRRVFPDPDQELPQDWRFVRLGDLGDQTRGDPVQTGPFGAQLPSREFVSSGVPVLNIGNVQWGHLDLSRLDHVTPEKASELERYRVKQGDLLFTRSGTVGRSAVVPAMADGWLISYHLLRVALDSRLAYPDFVAAAIMGCPYVLSQVRLAAGRGATRDGVNTSILFNLRIPLPPLAEQQCIAAELKEQTIAHEHIWAGLEGQLAEINALPAALLRRAFSGDI